MRFIIFLAYVFSIFRLPFAVAPYLAKLVLFYFLRDGFSAFWNQYHIQSIRILGEFLNLTLTTWIFYLCLSRTDHIVLTLFLELAIISEVVRFAAEKGFMILSAVWQGLPHRALARKICNNPRFHFLKSYSRYYILSDEKRLEKTLRRLKAMLRLANQKQVIEKMRYVNSFRIVPDSMGLRSGVVRDIARGEIYVHAGWSSNPDLLRGLALRRSPWIFDPRYLRRPFYYRTEANYMMTLFVFENARSCPGFAVYQFGHEIKSARYDIFYRFFRRLGVELELPVCEDGTNHFDILAKSILQEQNKGGRPLWTDEEVLADMRENQILSTLEIAEKYTYPLIYVQDVLIPKIMSNFAAVHFPRKKP